VESTDVEAVEVIKNFYISGQWTSKFVDMHQSLLTQLSGSTVKASMPPFNNPLKMQFPESMIAINVPVFGVKITSAMLKIFDNPNISDLLTEFEITIPQNRINTFVQQKMFKVYAMLDAGRAEPTIADTQKEAMDRVEKFCKEFEALTSKTINGTPAWEAFIKKHVSSNWADNLHLDNVLSNFGFDNDAADRLGKMEYVWPDGEKLSYSDYSLRWLSKVFLSYGPQVMVTDTVNLVFAMMNVENLREEALISEVIERFGKKLNEGDVDDLWVPTHFIMDAESDDFLAWAIIEWVHRLRGTDLEVLVQLAMDPELDALAGRLAATMHCSLIRDKGSRNAQAIKEFISAASLKTRSPHLRGTRSYTSRAETQTSRAETPMMMSTQTSLMVQNGSSKLRT